MVNIFQIVFCTSQAIEIQVFNLDFIKQLLYIKQIAATY